MALPDDLPSGRDPEEEHPRRYVHGYHLLVLSHGFEERIAVAVVAANGFIRPEQWWAKHICFHSHIPLGTLP